MSEYLLSDSDQNDEEHNKLYDDIEKAIGLKFTSINKIEKFVPSMGAFSKILEITNGFLYDHPALLEKFPNGFITENKFFMNNYTMRTQLPLSQINTLNLSRLAFVDNLVAIIEHKYNIAFDTNEINKIIKSTFGNDSNLDYAREQYVKTNEKPEFFSNDELALLCTTLNLSSASYFKNAGTSNDYIDSILKDSVEVNNPDHPFSKLKPLIKNIDSVELSSETINKYVSASSYICNPEHTKAILDTLHTMTDKNLQNSSTLDEFMIKFKEQFVPVVLTLSDTNFLSAMNNLNVQLSEANKPYLNMDSNVLSRIPTAVKTTIAKTINEYNQDGISITRYKRDLLINSLSNINLVFSDNSFMERIPQKKQSLQADHEVSTPKFN